MLSKMTSKLPLPDDLKSHPCFSKKVPGMQLAIDATSLEAFKRCPRLYYYSIIWGYQPTSVNVHFQFGIWIHEGTEQYDQGKAAGLSHEENLALVVRAAMRKTWDKTLNRGWQSEEPTKTRITLLRSLVWYLDKFGPNDSIETVIDKNGQPMVELNFCLDSGIWTNAGERLMLAGYGDKIGRMSGDMFWVDKKTTKSALDERYFRQFKPHNQFGLYNFVGKVLYDLPTKGLIVDAFQLLVNGTRFQRKIIPQSESEADEFLEGFAIHAHWMEECAEAESWPMRETSCVSIYGECAFRKICSLQPEQREVWLKKEFSRRVWNPLEKRGDV